MHFIVKGRTGRGLETVHWEDGVLTGDAFTLEVLERRAKLMEDDKGAPFAINVNFPGIPKHLSDPALLVSLLIYDTTFPAMFDNGELVEFEVPQMALPPGAV